ncbi:DUF3472 domain-containing protein [Luteolibacter flavescens]|uniref:DUF3472 domain-containing protein n=1 Tax=Luteolibacter flavescens TaxID=1859460 RepID=A0ABT3FP76_9BACT|nr:DUF3472 domain-containing protein [Luteolibacter flavescens]MCW1885375.1 DUF3472 domain-containing protein [Luteolibacter flavescens]
MHLPVQIRPWLLIAGLATLPLHAQEKAAASWTVPLGGNAYVTAGEAGQGGRGGPRWDSPDTVRSIYFRVDRPAELRLALKASVPQGGSKVRATVAGKSFEADLKGSGEFPLGTVKVTEAGYVRVDLQGVKKSGPVFAEATDLLVTSETPEVAVAFVKDNEDNRFYWGRRGPSVHLTYRLPEDKTIEWFYNEVTVPEGKDPIGSYFMANGFGEGYFGIQVNGPEERRVLFSVWSPYSTDRPSEIPEDQRIVLLAKGEGVHGGEFGGEGSGGQSYLRYPWKAGTTYRFLNRAKPDGKGHTVYTAWFFAPEAGEWKIIASFKRPKTDKHLTGAHSFLENFSDRNGWQYREAHYGNQWARDTEGKWHSLTEARFTGDDIARRGYRLDYGGGVTGDEFFMRNGGYFVDTVKLDSRFKRPANGKSEPAVDLEKLEGLTSGLE